MTGRDEVAGKASSSISAPRIFRTRTHTDGPFAGQIETYHPHRSRYGTYTLGARERQDRHHVGAKVSASDLVEVARLLSTKRYCLRMRGDLTGQVNMMQPDVIVVTDGSA